jgi:DNA-binding transcriptional ArsR family regulator
LRPRRHISDPDLAKALAHPLRIAALAVLEERTASPSEIAAELGASLGQVSYHVRTLARYGLVKLVETRPRRGALEHYYRAEQRPVITNEAWERIPSIVKSATVRAALEQVAAEVSAAAESGGFERPDSHLTRSPLALDQPGWNELVEKFDELYAEIEQIAARSAQRLDAEKHAEAIRASAVLMLFEAAPEPAPERSSSSPRRGAGRQAGPRQ